MKNNALNLLFCVGVSLMLSPMNASAHALLVKAEPAQDGVITAAPQQVAVWFNENVGDQYMALAVIDGQGKRMDNKDAKFNPSDHSNIIVTLPEITPGSYTVRYRVLSADGHIINGKYGFSYQK